MHIYQSDFFKNMNQDNTTIIFDTNVIIDFYSYSPLAIKEIVESLTENIDYFWLPYQVQYEYEMHFKESNLEAVNRYKNLKSEVKQGLNNTLENLKAKLNRFINNGNTEIFSLNEQIIESLNLIMVQSDEKLETLNSDYQEVIEDILVDDIIEMFVRKLSYISDARIFNRNELMNISEEGEVRYKYRLAPGFSDINKKDTAKTLNDLRIKRYGDFIIWKEILEYAKQFNKNIIFIENERKSDWWDKKNINGNMVPVNMLEEFSQLNTGKKFSVINFEEFLYHFGNTFSMPANTLNEISSKLKHENEVIEYLEENIDTIFDTYVSEQVDNIGSKTYERLIYELLIGTSCFGGSVGELEWLDINSMQNTFTDVEYGRESRVLYFNFESILDYNVDIREYVNRNVSHSGNINVKVGFNGCIGLSINISDIERPVDKSYDIYDFEVDFVDLEGINVGEFSIDVDFNEDIYRER